MKKLATDQAIGNNLESYKAKRVTINLFNDPSSSNNYGKYFFDEYPELQNKKIVGIKLNSGASTYFANAVLILQGFLNQGAAGVQKQMQARLRNR